MLPAMLERASGAVVIPIPPCGIGITPRKAVLPARSTASVRPRTLARPLASRLQPSLRSWSESLFGPARFPVLPRAPLDGVSIRGGPGGFGAEFVDYYTHIKNAEIDRFLAEVTDWEHREYFEMF